MTNAHGVARDQLRAFVERIERLSEEKKTIEDDIRDVLGEAKSMGFCTKTLKKIVALRKKDENERAEEEAILDTYKMALGMTPQMDMFEDDAPKAKSPAMALQSPRKAVDAVSERTEINQPETAEQAEPEAAADVAGDDLREPVAAEQGQIIREGDAPRETDRFGGDASSPDTGFETCERCQGNGEIVTNWERYRHPHEGDIGDEAVAECPDCGGEGIIDATKIAPASHGEAEAPSAERVSPAEGGSAAANTGGDHVDPDHSHAATAGTRINHIVPATPPKNARDFRPHCLKPDACGASGLSHCYSCRRAMENQEEMA